MLGQQATLLHSFVDWLESEGVRLLVVGTRPQSYMTKEDAVEGFSKYFQQFHPYPMKKEGS